MSMLLAAPAEGAPPLWSVLPFAFYLLVIALCPLVARHFWEKNRNRLAVAIAFSIPAAAYLLAGPEHGAHWLGESLLDYAAFIALLAALYVIAGGIYLKGSLVGTPLVNSAVIGFGAVLASLIGTTGASMLLIRPLLRANAMRARRVHIVIFFIFIVSNAGGLLTPLGDPPLFLGFLKGVPFLWTLKMALPWLFVNGTLLAIFHVIDEIMLNRDEREKPGALLEEVQKVKEPLRIEGKRNFLFLLAVIGVNVGASHQATQQGWSLELLKVVLAVGMVAIAGLSLALSPKRYRAANNFSWGPILEVLIVFLGIFVTMVPALRLLESMGRSGQIALSAPWQFFWVTGALSSVLDNAPTYLTFASLAVGVVNKVTGSAFSADHLGPLVESALGEALLLAISCGAVFMGAVTYIGNGPNFMVKAIAESSGVRMPSFFGYIVWSLGALVPILIAATFLFFRGTV